jgi:Zn-dependent protease with chaperone function
MSTELTKKASATKNFPSISSRAWEHPADRAALQALRKVPGLDQMIRRVMPIVSERPLRIISAGSAVEVGPKQFAKVNKVYEEVLAVLDAPRRYDLFVTQNPVINAGAVGFDDPFIVLNSATVNQLSEQELRCVLGHEVGHILSDHVLYKTMLRIILRGAIVVLRMPVTGLVWMAVVGALLEWDRKSELSADRASLLACQSPDVVRKSLLHIAGGVGKGASVKAFQEQARRYEEEGSKTDGVLKMLALLGRRHPFPVQRIKELDEWIDSGEYERILGGDYAVREDDPEPKETWQEWKQTASDYADGFKSSADPVARWMRDTGLEVTEKAREWFESVRTDGE